MTAQRNSESIHHHPGEDLLLDYAAGTLGESWSLALATHLALCPECRRTIALLEALGGEQLEDLPPEPVAMESFDAVLARLDEPFAEDQVSVAIDAVSGSETPILPSPLRRYVGGDAESVSWKRLGLGAHHFVVPTKDETATVRLLRIPAGKPVPEHSHRGRELTLILQGSFVDKTGRYARGDLQDADEELEHQPIAEPGEACICLAVTDAPLRFKGFAGRLLEPFLGI